MQQACVCRSHGLDSQRQVSGPLLERHAWAYLVQEGNPEMRRTLAALGQGRRFKTLGLCPRYLLGFSVVEINDVAIGVYVLLPWPRASCAGGGAHGGAAGLVHAERVLVLVVVEIFVGEFVYFFGVYEGLSAHMMSFNSQVKRVQIGDAQDEPNIQSAAMS